MRPVGCIPPAPSLLSLLPATQNPPWRRQFQLGKECPRGSEHQGADVAELCPGLLLLGQGVLGAGGCCGGGSSLAGDLPPWLGRCGQAEPLALCLSNGVALLCASPAPLCGHSPQACPRLCPTAVAWRSLGCGRCHQRAGSAHLPRAPRGCTRGGP